MSVLICILVEREPKIWNITSDIFSRERSKSRYSRSGTVLSKPPTATTTMTQTHVSRRSSPRGGCRCSGSTPRCTPSSRVNTRHSFPTCNSTLCQSECCSGSTSPARWARSLSAGAWIDLVSSQLKKGDPYLSQSYVFRYDTSNTLLMC